jgi:small subunit ribosomal protein S8e
MQWNGRSVRKETGGRIRFARSKRRSEVGNSPADSHIGEDRTKIIRTLGANQKIRVLRAQYANVANQKSGEIRRVAIETVDKNTANPNFVRRNLLTKGAIIKTEIGDARIVSRPGQDGVINAVLNY